MRQTVLKRRLTMITIVAAAAVVAILISLVNSGTRITRARIEAAIAPTFANLYVQQSAILDVPGISANRVAAHATCDKGGPKVADVGAGSDWICTITFNDQTGTPQSGKFELQVHSNACYTAAGPTKLIGLQTITDSYGRDVTNPVFEFDGCFDPHG
jgi:hypothetical protein